MQVAGLRVAMIAVHTSPLDQPGTGDAGGMNVYLNGLAGALADAGATVSIFTRATGPGAPRVIEPRPGVRVHELAVGPAALVAKEKLPDLLPAVARAIAESCAPGDFDVVHSHYWLSGLVGERLAREWGVPLVHSMHTLARMKDLNLAPGEHPEPARRVTGEQRVVAAADALVASTAHEAQSLVALYGAAPDVVHVVAPGVDLDVFTPGARRAARERVGLTGGEPVVLFVGRIQPLKAPDVLVRALCRLRNEGAALPRLVVLGGPSGSPDHLSHVAQLAAECDLSDRVTLRDPVPPRELADWYRAADAVAMPSRSETFGFVAAEALACGTPVIAADVGGLGQVVEDGTSGVLVTGHDAGPWATAITRVLHEPGERERLAAGAVAGRDRFTWQRTGAGMLGAYRAARVG